MLNVVLQENHPPIDKDVCVGLYMKAYDIPCGHRNEIYIHVYELHNMCTHSNHKHRTYTYTNVLLLPYHVWMLIMHEMRVMSHLMAVLMLLLLMTMKMMLMDMFVYDYVLVM